MFLAIVERTVEKSYGEFLFGKLCEKFAPF